MDNQKSVVVSNTNTEITDPFPLSKFNPHEHLIEIKSSKGKSLYLEVKYRLVWFRSLCPNGSIRTEMIHLDLDRETEDETFAWNNETRRSEKIIKRAPGIAIFRAIVEDGKGGHAEGTKCEKAASFGDFIEKAETGAIGRALAELGYGTQFVGEEFDEGHRIVDAPVAPAENHSRQSQSSPRAQASSTPRTQRSQPTEAEQEAYRQRRVVVESDNHAPADRPVQSANAEKPKPAYYDVYQAGKEKNLWQGIKGFCEFAAEKLGVPVTPENVANLAKPRLDQLKAEVTGQDPTIKQKESAAV